MNFGQRKFSCIEEHDQALMDNWNNVIKHQRDITWVLGDVAMDIECMKLLPAFNGQKRLILGNHDKFDLGVYQKYFHSIHAFERRYHGMVMTHIPIHPNELQYRTWKWNIHGHCHNIDKAPRDPRYINVNADAIRLTPISLEQIQEICTLRKGKL